MKKRVIEQIAGLMPKLRDDGIEEGEMALIVLNTRNGDTSSNAFLIGGEGNDLLVGLTVAALNNSEFHEAMTTAVRILEEYKDAVRADLNKALN